MIASRIPDKARYIPTSNSFTAAFGAPVIGQYSFNVPANVNQVVYAMDANSVYFIDTISIGGTVSGEDYLAAILTLPLITFRRLQGNEHIYTQKMPVPTFAQSRSVSCYVKSDKGGDAITMDFSGVLNQIANFVGIATITINVSCNLFVMDNAAYTAQFANYNKAF
jgi:hypothetical protein